MKNNQLIAFKRLKNEVVDTRLCTHCGLCAGMTKNIVMKEAPNGPLPMGPDEALLSEVVFNSCPGREINYPELNRFVFGRQPNSWLVGNYKSAHIGYSEKPKIRNNGASGGIITQVLLELIATKKVDGIITSQVGLTAPYIASSFIATTEKEIRDSSQSIYSPVPVLAILEQLKDFDGKVAMVGLPDQVAAVRSLQRFGNKIAKKIVFIIGPYVGTNMYFESIKSFMRSNGVNSLEEISKLRYRDGEWPGHLAIYLTDGRVLKAEKFYYNYLIPFFITRSSLTSVDFTNELTDISVGDAWHPKYESIGKGFSVVIARTNKGSKILKTLRKKKTIALDEIGYSQLIQMHSHMLEFKKRGAFIRLRFISFFGGKTPNYYYSIKSVPVTRYIIEVAISLVFFLSSTRVMRWLVEKLPICLVGPTFNFLRLNWKKLTKSSKRKGIDEFEFLVEK